MTKRAKTLREREREKKTYNWNYLLLITTVKSLFVDD